MTSIPPVRVEFIGSSDPLVREFQKLNAAAGTSSKGLNTMNAGFRESAKQADKFQQGLANLKAQQVAGTATTNAHTAAIKTQALSVGQAVAGLRALAGGYIGMKVLGFINDTIEAGAALHDLAQKTGATTEALSVLQFVGRRNDVTAGDLAVAFKSLALAMGQLREGGKDATEAFARIGLSAKDLEGLSVDQVFNRITQAIAGLPDGFDKAEAATKVFGRSGAALIPLINEIAERGLPALTEEARNAGAVLSTEAAASADEFRDALDNMKSAAAGAARSILNPLLPAMTMVAQAMQELFSRKPGDTLRHDLEDIAHLLDVITFKSFNLRDKLDHALGRDKQTLSPSQTRDEAFETKPIVLPKERTKAQKDLAAETKREADERERAAEAAQRELDAVLEMQHRMRADQAGGGNLTQGGRSIPGLPPGVPIILQGAREQGLESGEGDEIQRQLEEAQDAAAEFAATLQSEVSFALESAIFQSHSFGEAVRNLFGNIAQSIASMLIQKGVGALLGGVAFAEGGYVSGPGGPTSDSIPARLSNGEFVVNAASTAQNLPLLRQINSRPFQLSTYRPGHYASGGLVASGTAQSGSFSGHISLDRGLIMEVVDKDFPVHVQNHRKTIKGSL